jgi:hypothetical protein
MSAIGRLEALRAIGNDLEMRGVKTFVIRCEAELYVVEAGYQSPPAPTPVILHYTLDDIEQLDREGREGDDRDSGVKDFLSLSQILRAIGTYLSFSIESLDLLSRSRKLIPGLELSLNASFRLFDIERTNGPVIDNNFRRPGSSTPLGLTYRA